MNSRTAIIVIVVLALVLGGWWYSQKPSTITTDVETNNKENLTGTEATTTENTTPAAVTPETKTFTVEGRNFAFFPNTITVHKGDRVKIIFQNTGGVHDFVIDEFKARTKVISAGQQDIVEFTADKEGSFEYYCSVGTHRQMGMAGTLTVK